MTDAPTGLPRPVAPAPDGRRRPIPWSQDGRKWGIVHDGRRERAESRDLCLLCGDPLTADAVGFYLPGEAGWMDSAGLHPRCSRLTVAHCEHVRRILKDGRAEIRPYVTRNHTTALDSGPPAP